MDKDLPSKRITAGGLRLTLKGISAQDPYWKSIGRNFEPEFQLFCKRYIRPDDVCLDLGANIGFKTLLMAKQCPRGRVIAVEAGATVAACLAANLRANGIDNAVVVNAAASDHDGTVLFDEHSAWGHVKETGRAVGAITLRELVRRYDLARLDFIKLDVEGSEFAVLRDSLDLLARFNSLVLVELNSLTLLAWGDVSPMVFIRWITANFRFVFVLERAAGKALLTPIGPGDRARKILHRNLIDDRCVTDLVLSNDDRRFGPLAASHAPSIRRPFRWRPRLG